MQSPTAALQPVNLPPTPAPGLLQCPAGRAAELRKLQQQERGQTVLQNPALQSWAQVSKDGLQQCLYALLAMLAN